MIYQQGRFTLISPPPPLSNKLPNTTLCKFPFYFIDDNMPLTTVCLFLAISEKSKHLKVFYCVQYTERTLSTESRVYKEARLMYIHSLDQFSRP